MNEFRNIQAAKIRAVYGADEIVKSEESTIEKTETEVKEELIQKSVEEDEELDSPSFEDLEGLGILEKGGEGSKGGTVIGHTKSGKPIYDTASHESHSNFNKTDHKDASSAHKKLANQYGEVREIGNAWKHKEQSYAHEVLSKIKKSEDDEDLEKEV